MLMEKNVFDRGFLWHWREHTYHLMLFSGIECVTYCASTMSSEADRHPSYLSAGISLLIPTKSERHPLVTTSSAKKKN